MTLKKQEEKQLEAIRQALEASQLAGMFHMFNRLVRGEHMPAWETVLRFARWRRWLQLGLAALPAPRSWKRESVEVSAICLTACAVIAAACIGIRSNATVAPHFRSAAAVSQQHAGASLLNGRR